MSRVALVTGGGTGIGAAVARRLPQTVSTSSSPAGGEGPIREVAAEIGGLAIVADTGVEADAERAVAEAVDRFGGLDALVLNAGIAGYGSLVDMEPGLFEDIFRVERDGRVPDGSGCDSTPARAPWGNRQRSHRSSALRAARLEPRVLLVEGQLW